MKTFKTVSELFNEMYKLGIQNMSSFYKDLITDTEVIEESLKEGNSEFHIYWIVREHGTHISFYMLDAAKKASNWKKEYKFTARIQGLGDEFIFEIIDKNGEIKQ